ncbi:hypothetical protein AMTRI_Chr10g7530 [Amborella trichopoda]
MVISLLSQNSEEMYGALVSGNHGLLLNVGTIIFGFLLPILLSLMVFGKKKAKTRGVPVEVGGEPGFTVRNNRFDALVELPWEGASTLAALFEQACTKYSRNKFIGSRKLISRETMTSGDGRPLEKLHLGEYEWLSFTETFNRACDFASGLVKLGHNPNLRVVIFAETRAEWFIALQGCFRKSITVVTIYASLGEEALTHSINETQVSTVICDSKQLKKLAAISSNLETVKNIIYIEDAGVSVDSGLSEKMPNCILSSFSEVEKIGKENPTDPILPVKTDIAVIMYTSGSTGVPKGVMMTHGNIIATAAAVITTIPNLGIKDIYLAYLPLAHVLELAAEAVMLAAGCAIGYGSAWTLTDTSNKIKQGTEGDASALKPTLMAAVPAILDRVRDGVRKKVEEKGGMSKKLFDIGYKRRLAAIEGSWFGAWGLEKVLWDFIVFKRIRSILGGHVRGVLCGGAPLSGDTQRFTNICLGAPVEQAYGLTETCAGGTFSDWDDESVGRVGPPLPCCYVKLISWEEGGYRTSDTPMPRGEVVIGGLSVTPGYFKNEEKTKEVYKTDEKGVRWFYTGDIGRCHPDGCLEIIDRKKDIVKLQHGEYISLGKVEAALLTSNYVDNIMVHADPFHSYCVALVVPSRRSIESWAKNSGIECKDFTDLCQKQETIKEVQQALMKAGKDAKLDKFEIPAKIMLSPDPWTPESGLVTAALKIKRENLKTKFKEEVHNLYE